MFNTAGVSMNNFWKYFVMIGNLLCKCMPMIIVVMFITKLKELSCIELTDKLYLMLGCIAIITYWTMNFVGGEDE
jgi:hypothetical protein